MTLQEHYTLLEQSYKEQITQAKDVKALMTSAMEIEPDLGKVLTLTIDRLRQNEIIRELELSLNNLKS